MEDFVVGANLAETERLGQTRGMIFAEKRTQTLTMPVILLVEHRSTVEGSCGEGANGRAGCI